MRKKINIKLEYREEGETKEIYISIDFISNRVIKEFSQLISEASKVAKAHNRISDIYTTLAGENLEKEKKKELQKEIDKLNNVILEFNDNGYLENRMTLIKRLLVDNGYKNHEMLMDDDFWDEKVDPADLMIFMYSAVYKDVDNKKKVMM